MFNWKGSKKRKKEEEARMQKFRAAAVPDYPTETHYAPYAGQTGETYFFGGGRSFGGGGSSDSYSDSSSSCSSDSGSSSDSGGSCGSGD